MFGHLASHGKPNVDHGVYTECLRASKTRIFNCRICMWHIKMTQTITCHTHTHMQIFRRIMSCAEAGVRVRATIWVAPLSLSLLKRARVQQRATCSVHAASNVASANNILIFLCSMSCAAAGHVAGPEQARLTWLQSLDPTDGTCRPSSSAHLNACHLKPKQKQKLSCPRRQAACTGHA